MKFHKVLLLVTLIGLPTCVLLFYSIDKYSDANDRGLNLLVGWIGWIAVLTVIVPRAVPARIRAEWFSKEYGVGTLLLLLGNVIGTIAADYLGYTLAQ